MHIRNTEDWALLLLAQIHLAPDSNDTMLGSVSLLKGLSYEVASSVTTLLNTALKDKCIIADSVSSQTSLTSNSPYGFTINKDGGCISYKGPRFEKRSLINVIHSIKKSPDELQNIESQSSLSNPKMTPQDQIKLILSVDLSKFANTQATAANQDEAQTIFITGAA
ncbi:MAG: hypothetical protein ACK5WS_03735 [Alphaproteobacteria bacterium]|jgi:hypothetical protein|nr:hypothetical protein [Candidatus Jidaibacter sp.]